MTDQLTLEQIFETLDTLGIDALREIREKTDHHIDSYEQQALREACAAIKRIAKEHGLAVNIDTKRRKRGRSQKAGRVSGS